MFVRQAVILCGGLGTRLGELTADTPKPLLEIAGTPFLGTLIQEVSRAGIRRFLLLAGHLANKVEDFAAALEARLGPGYSIDVSVEPEPAGTGGALFEARNQLDDLFLLLNGDSFLDFPVHRLAEVMDSPAIAGAVALRAVEDSSRYGEVMLDENRITEFVEKSGAQRSGLINGGAYILRKEVVDALAQGSSLERDLLPRLAAEGRLAGKAFEGFFIDIGLPETYAQAERTLCGHRRRPAAFLDRDGVLNRDLGHVGTIERWEWTDGAIDAIRGLNDAGYYVFVVTNQAGIAKGKYDLQSYWSLRDAIRDQLLEQHAQIDDERFCPYHPDAIVDVWRGHSDWRKPAPGMLLDLLAAWPVDRDRSFLVGDQPSDVAAAESAGIRGYLFDGGNLESFISAIIGR
jgi:D,D-heptose 1,7-bisphosphate phosphatase